MSEDSQLVFHKLLVNAIPGFVAGTLLVLLGLITRQPGVQEAVSDLYKHAFYIHPFLLSTVGTLVCGSLLMQGADANKDLDRLLTVPTLKFFSHLFSVGLGASVPLAFVVWGYFDASACHGTVAVFASWFVLFIYAALSTAGLLAIEARGAEDGKSKLKHTAGPWALRGFAVLTLFAIGSAVVTVQKPGSTQELIRSGQEATANFVCGPGL